MSSSQIGWTRSDSLAFVDDGDRVAVLVLDRLDQLGARVLSGPAATIFRATDVSHHGKAILEEVARVSRVEPAAVEADVQNFLAELEALGVLVRR